MKTKIILLIIVLNTLNSCNNVITEIRFMKDLNNAISEKYETEKVEISTNNKSKLIVSISDVKFSDYSKKEKQQISNQIGEMARDLKDKKIRICIVKFVSTDKYGIIKRSDAEIYRTNY